MTQAEHAYRIAHGLSTIDSPPRFHAGPYNGLNTLTAAGLWTEPSDGTSHVATIQIYRQPDGSIRVKTVTPDRTWEDTFPSLSAWARYGVGPGLDDSQ